MLADTLQRWRSDPVTFIQQVMINPETSEPFVLLDAEREFLSHAFKTDQDGRLLYSEQVFSAPKKSGKTLFGAMHLLTTVLLFGGKYAEGYCVANDLEQAQGRVFEAVRRIVLASPQLKREAKVTPDRIVFRAVGATITAMASHYESAAGGHPTISVFDELWGYTSERSRRLWDEMIPVPTRKISCRLIVTHAGFSAESLLLEEIYRRGLQQPRVGTDLHAGDGLLMLWSHTPLAPWQDAKWLAEMRRSLRPTQYARMIENRFTTSEPAFDSCVDPDLHPVVTGRSLPVWCGVDASIRHDSTALCAVTWDEERCCVRLVAHRIFQPSPEHPIDFENAIEQTLFTWRGRYSIKSCLFDPYQMIAVSQRLTREGVRMEEFPQTSGNLTEASQNLFELIQGRNFVGYPDEAIRVAVARAVAIEGPRGWRIGKDKQTHKIDIVVALAMASLACVRAQKRGRIRLVIRAPDYAPLHGPAPQGYEIDPVTCQRLDRQCTRIRFVRLTEQEAPAVRGRVHGKLGS